MLRQLATARPGFTWAWRRAATLVRHALPPAHLAALERARRRGIVVGGFLVGVNADVEALVLAVAALMKRSGRLRLSGLDAGNARIKNIWPCQ